MLHIPLSLMITSLMAAPLGTDRVWDERSDPTIMSTGLQYHFSRLPLKGSVRAKDKLWSGDYWPLRRGLINYRWYAQQKIGFNLRSPTREEVSKMTLYELAQLAPSEKYDLFIGRYDYPLKQQVAAIASPRALSWEGICHGVAPASINHEEPTPKLIKNPDGIEIPFGSSDIKALLAYFYAHGFESPTNQMGRRCEIYDRRGTCEDDLNAASFHLILTNLTGLRSESFVMDIQNNEEVWNHPVKSYDTQIIQQNLPPGRYAAPGTSKVLRLKTTVEYISGSQNSWHPIIGTPQQVTTTRKYEYDLELDEQGRVIGGEWLSKDRPDFLWIKPRPKRFPGIFFKLEQLIHD